MDWELALYDIRPDLLEPLVKRLPPSRATARRRLDLYDREGLRPAVDDAALVVLGTGPYIHTSAPVIDACLQAKLPYLDFDDDVESTQHELSLPEDWAEPQAFYKVLGRVSTPSAEIVGSVL